MNRYLFDRSTGALAPAAFARLECSRLTHAFQHEPRLRFDGSVGAGQNEDVPGEEKIWAHQAGVNALVIDPFDKQLLLSGGADSSIRLWDLDQIQTTNDVQTLRPAGKVASAANKFGITRLSFYTFDAAAFLSSSYDHTLKLYATDLLTISATFDLDSIVYTHAISPIASHLLVACATQHPAIRLVDLKSGASTHSLAGHHGAILSVAWSPTHEHILASGCIDGTVRIWDVRKSAGTLGLLDMEDSIGVDNAGVRAGGRVRESAKAHNGAVNGLTWTDDGRYIITAGHDERVRVWSAASGANTLASFGPTIKNSHLSSLPLMSSPTALTLPGKEMIFYPNEHEILVFELHEGSLLKRLKVPGPVMAAVRSRTGERNVRNRVTSLAWRGVSEGLYSGHADGQVRAWLPMNDENDEEEEWTDGQGKHASDEEDGKRRKRKVLDDVLRDLTRQKITFG